MNIWSCYVKLRTSEVPCRDLVNSHVHHVSHQHPACKLYSNKCVECIGYQWDIAHDPARPLWVTHGINEYSSWYTLILTTGTGKEKPAVERSIGRIRQGETHFGTCLLKTGEQNKIQRVKTTCGNMTWKSGRECVEICGLNGDPMVSQWKTGVCR